MSGKIFSVSDVLLKLYTWYENATKFKHYKRLCQLKTDSHAVPVAITCQYRCNTTRPFKIQISNLVIPEMLQKQF